MTSGPSDMPARHRDVIAVYAPAHNARFTAIVSCRLALVRFAECFAAPSLRELNVYLRGDNAPLGAGSIGGDAGELGGQRTAGAGGLRGDGAGASSGKLQIEGNVLP